MCKLFFRFEPIRTMAAAILAAITALGVVGSGKDHKPLVGIIIVFIGYSGQFLLLLLGFGHLVQLRYIG